MLYACGIPGEVLEGAVLGVPWARFLRGCLLSSIYLSTENFAVIRTTFYLRASCWQERVAVVVR